MAPIKKVIGLSLIYISSSMENFSFTKKELELSEIHL